MSTTMRTRTLSVHDAPDAIAEHEPFHTSGDHFHGAWITDMDLRADFGQLPDDYAQQLHEAHEQSAVYVIWSYRTVIAWLDPRLGHGWTIPEIHYSPTTSKHQARVLQGVRRSGFSVEQV